MARLDYIGVLQDAWTEEEESLLVSAHLRYGNRWSDIAKVIKGRTENAVKNHCKSLAIVQSGIAQEIASYPSHRHGLN